VRRLHLIPALSSALWLSACLDASRLNARCEWIGDTTEPRLDMATARDRRHLANDIRIAGENAVRYRDSLKVRVGFAAAAGLDVECRDRLHATIAARHAVGRADIAAAALMRDVPVDIALIYFPIAAIFFVVSLRLCRRLFRRLPPPGERWTVLVGAIWMGLIASASATVFAHLHSWNVDTARLHNFHLSFRASYLPIGRHPWLAFLVACAVFAVASWYEYRAARMRPADQAKGSPFRPWEN
jgi:hypothetical protein